MFDYLIVEIRLLVGEVLLRSNSDLDKVDVVGELIEGYREL